MWWKMTWAVCQLIVLTLQCCCVPCASKQANPWLLTVTPKKQKNNCSFVYLCCVMSIWIVYFLTFLNYWRVFISLYIWCTFHWLKLWSLQIWGWIRGLKVKKKKKGMSGAKEAGRGFLWSILGDLEWVRKTNYGDCWYARKCEGQECEWFGFWRFHF